MQNKGKIKGRIILTILSGIAGIALFGYILIMSQSRMTLRSLQDEMKENSSYICDTFNFFKNRGKALQIWSDELYKDSFLVMKMALEDDPGLASSEDFLKEMTSLIDTEVFWRYTDFTIKKGGAGKWMTEDVRRAMTYLYRVLRQ